MVQSDEALSADGGADLSRPPRPDGSGLRECDFGLFEYRNYVEMAEDPRYQAWVDSNGTLPFPGGEDGEEFRRRSCRTFLHIAENFREDGDEAAAFIVHGGTIMSILAEFEKPSRGFTEGRSETAAAWNANLYGKKSSLSF